MTDEIERKLEEYEKLSQAFTGLKAVFYINEVDKQGNIKLIWANKGLEYILGYTVEERKEMGQDFYRSQYHPDDYDSVMKIIYDAMKGEDEYAMIYRVRHKDGDWRWIFSMGNVFKKDLETGSVQAVSMAVDMTKQIVQNNDQLSVLLKENARLKNQLRINKLTPTEKKIIQMLASGQSVKKIAAAEYRSPETINNHKRNVFKKLGINKLPELVVFAIENGLN